MPVKVQAIYHVKEILESENIFVMDETRAGSSGHPSAEDYDPESDAAQRRYRAAASALPFQHLPAG